MKRPIVNYIDVGALDGNEALSFFHHTDALPKTFARDILDLLKMALGNKVFRPAFGASRSRFGLGRKRAIAAELEANRLEMNMLLVDPQLSSHGSTRLRHYALRTGNCRVYEVRAAVGLQQNQLGFEPLYMGIETGPLSAAIFSSLFRDKRVGASLYKTKSNVDVGSARNAFTLSVSAFTDLVEGMRFLDRFAFNIVRMNAEGIEYNILQEFDRRGLLKHIDLLCGSGRDLAKIDSRRYQEFQDFLEDKELAFVTFDGDDWRRLQFQRDYEKLIIEGAKRKASVLNSS